MTPNLAKLFLGVWLWLVLGISVTIGQTLSRLGEFRLSSYTEDFQGSPHVAALAQGGFVATWLGFSEQDPTHLNVVAQLYDGSGTPRGPEFLVNTPNASTTVASPFIASSRNGNFVVVWSVDGAAIYSRLFAANGSELRPAAPVSPGGMQQDHPVVAMTPGGAFVVAWQDGDGDRNGIHAQLFSPTGARAGLSIMANSNVTGEQTNPSVAIISEEGAFVVAWSSAADPTAAPADSEIYARLFKQDGTPKSIAGSSEEFPVAVLPGLQRNSSVAGLTNGGFVVVWEDQNAIALGDPNGYGIAGQRYDDTGMILGPRFLVNDETPFDQAAPSVQGLGGSGFVVTWTSPALDGIGTDVVFRRFNLGGFRLDPTEQIANTYALKNQIGAANGTIATTPEGNLFIVWQSELQDGSDFGVYADVFYGPNEGAPRNELRVHTTTAEDQAQPAVASNAAILSTPTGSVGESVVVWQHGAGTSGDGVFFQRFDMDALRVGVETRVTPNTPGTRCFPAVGLDQSKNFVVVWQCTQPGTDGSDIFARWYPGDAGTPLPAEFRVNAITPGEQTAPVVAMNAAGAYVVAWLSTDSGPNGAIRARIYPPSGGQGSPEIRADTAGTACSQPAVAINAAGEFVIVWQGIDAGGNEGILARRYDALGTEKELSPIQVNTSTTNVEANPAVALGVAGNFIVCWESRDVANTAGRILFQRYGSDGAVEGVETVAHGSTPAIRGNSSIAVDTTGAFNVVWNSHGADGSNSGVVIRRFDQNGAALGLETVANTTARGDQPLSTSGRALANDALGNYFIVWQSRDQDSSGLGVYGTKIFLPGTPVVNAATATNPTGDAITFMGLVNPSSSPTQVYFDYGPTTDLGLSTPPQSIGTGSTAAEASAIALNLTVGTQYFFRLVATNPQAPAGREVRSSILGFSTVPNQDDPPSAPPAALASLQVNLTPTGAAWRLDGETQWRRGSRDPLFDPAVDNASGLFVGSEYTIEFRPQDGLVQAPQKLLLTVAGKTEATVSYPPASADQGDLRVVLLPDRATNSAIVENRAQWRFEGEPNWRDANPSIPSDPSNPSSPQGKPTVRLPVGSYVIEFKPIPGFSRVSSRAIVVRAGIEVAVNAYYENPLTVTGTFPQVLDLPTVTTTGPYFLAGQVQTDLGEASGYVVKERVVLTAAHAVFDDQALTMVAAGTLLGDKTSDYASPGIRWRSQRMRGEYEPVPLEPRGSYVLSGYAASRLGKTPGQGTQTSQENDVAALYFNAPVAQGRSSGYLVTSNVTQWLQRSALKTMVSYPVDPTHVLDGNNIGKMHHTPPAELTFTQPYGTASPIYRTTDIAGVGGSSGGALCVQYGDDIDPLTRSKFFPAAVYVGGSGEAIFRVIDASVDELIRAADVSSRGGPNNVGGGSLQLNAQRSASRLSVSQVTVSLVPPNAIGAGAKWQLVSQGNTPVSRSSGDTVSVPAGSYTVTFLPAPGFGTPPSVPLVVDSNDQRVVRGVYRSITTGALAEVVAGQDYRQQIEATGVPLSFKQVGLPNGLSIDQKGLISGKSNTAGVFRVSIEAQFSNNPTDVARRDYTLLVRESGVLFVAFDAMRGAVTGNFRLVPGQNPVEVGKQIILTAKAKLPDFIFSGWRTVGALSLIEGSTLKLKIQSPDEALTVEAIFVENPFKSIAGAFTGRIRSSVPAVDSTGLLTVMLATSGQFTANLRLGTKSFGIKGNLQADGTATGVPVPGSPFQLNLALDLSGATQTLTGTLTGASSPQTGSYSQAGNTVTFSGATAHGFTVGASVHLDFTGGAPSAATGGNFVVASVSVDGLQFTFEYLSDSISRSGSAVATAAPLSYSLDRKAFHKKRNPALAYEGAYTLAVLRNPQNSNEPQGHGYGTVRVSPDGSIRFVGTLGDGTAVMQGSTISKAGRWQVYVPLYAKKGFVTGDIAFNPLVAIEDSSSLPGGLDGALSWLRPSSTASRAPYPQGFATEVMAQGSSYKKESPVSYSTATVSVGEGNLSQSNFAVNVDAALGFRTADGAAFRMQAIRGTGFFSGRFPDANGVSRLFRGVLLPASDRGYGQFTGPAFAPPDTWAPRGFIEVLGTKPGPANGEN